MSSDALPFKLLPHLRNRLVKSKEKTEEKDKVTYRLLKGESTKEHFKKGGGV